MIQIVCLLLLMIDPGLTQEVRIIHASGEVESLDIASLDSLQNILDGSMSTTADQGYLEARGTLSQDGSRVEFRITEGPASRIPRERIHFAGMPLQWQEALREILLLHATELAPRDITAARFHLEDQGWRLIGPPRLTRDTTSGVHLLLPMQAPDDLQLAGTLGLDQTNADSLRWIGLIHLRAPNLGKPGRVVGLDWKRTRSDAESLEGEWKETRFFDPALDLTLRLSREVVNGNYQVLQRALTLGWDLDWNQKLSVSARSRDTRLTFQGRQSHPQWQSNGTGFLGLHYRNGNLLRTHAIRLQLRSGIEGNWQQDPRGERQLFLRTEGALTPGTHLVLRQQSAVLLRTGVDAATDPGVLNPLGGVETVRGHVEDEQRCVDYVLLRHDLIWWQREGVSFFLLADWAWYDTGLARGQLLGYGVGLKIPTGRQRLVLQLAKGPGTLQQNLLLHLKFEMETLWIDR